MADQQVQGMLVQIEATTAQLRRELANADQVVARSTQAIDRNLASVDTAFDRTGRAAQSAGGLMRGAFAAVAGAGLVGGIIKQVDAIGQMSDRMRAAASGTAEYQQVQQHLLQTAQETYRPLAEAQELYIRTADVMRSLGYNTQQTLDITDSFSFLLVTNAASADKAGSALDAYSKALQTGKVDADGWVSIQSAMPTIVDTIAAGTGKSAEAIRKLGVEGKLSLDYINTGLLHGVDANRKAAAQMSTSVQDALVNINNAVGTFLGNMEDRTGLVGSLSQVLLVLADNVDLVATAMAGAGAAALTLYVAKAGVAIKSAITQRLAEIENARAALRAAEAQRIYALAQVQQAEASVAATTGLQRLSVVQTQLLPKQAALTASTEALTIAQANLTRAATGGLLSALGGPVGLALLAGTAAASFLMLSENSDGLEKKLCDLAEPLDKVVERFNKLNSATQAVALRELQGKIDDLQSNLGQTSGAIADKFENDLRGMGAAGVDGFIAGLAPMPQEAQRALDLVRAAANQAATGAVVDWKAVADEVRGIPGVTEAMAQAIETGQIKASDLSVELINLRAKLAELTGETDRNTASTQANNAAKAGMSSAGQTYLDTLQKQLAGLQDNGDAIKIANRHIAENADLTETDRLAILSAASAIEAQKKANKDSTQGSKDRAKALKDEVKALDAIIDRALPERKRLDDLKEGIQGLRKAQASGKITAAEMELGIKNLNTAYAAPVLQKRAEEERKLAEARRNSAESYRKAMEVVLQTRQDAINADVSGIGMGDNERDQADRLNGVRQKYAEARRQLEEQQEDVSRRLSDDAYHQRLADLGDFQARELQMEVDGYDARLVAQRDYRNGAKRAWANIQADAQNVAGTTDEMLTSGFNTAKDALAEFAITGKANFKDFASSVIADMARIASQQAASSLLSTVVGWGVSAAGSYFGGAGNGMTPGSAGAVSSNLGASQVGYGSGYFPQALGGAWSGGVQMFAKGGAFATNSVLTKPTGFGMAGGGLGIAGEAGPEAIMPLARGADGSLGVQMVGGGGGGSTIVQVSVPMAVTLEDRSSEGMELDTSAFQQNMQRQMQGIAEKAVSDSWRAGGLSHRNSSGRR